MTEKIDLVEKEEIKNDIAQGSTGIKEEISHETASEELEFIEKKSFLKRTWKWFTEDKQRMWSIIFLFLFVVLIIVLAALNLNLGEIMRNIVDWFKLKLGIWGIFIGVFIISIFGNFTVIFPIPYTLALVTVATDPTIQVWHVIVMGIFAGAGASLGEISAWLLGKASKNVIEDGMEKQVIRAQKWIDKGLAPFIIFIFAATPLPDDAILIFIGLLGYALWKTIIWCFLGKIVLTTATGLAAKYLGDTALGEKILWLFGLKIGESGVTATEPEAWISALVWVATIVLIGIILFIDWGDVWNFLSRSALKKKYRKLVVPTGETHESMTALNQEIEESLSFRKTRLLKEDSFWQCAISKEGDEIPDYYDLYSISFVLGKTSNILLKPDWYSKFTDNLSEEKFNKLNQYHLEKLLPPKKIKESYISEEKLQEITENMIFLSFITNHLESNAKFKVGFLLEKISEQQVKVRCIGEKEALIIKSIKSIPHELMVANLVKLLDYLSETPELVKKLDVAYIS